MSFHTTKAGTKVYVKVPKTERIREIISYAKSKGSSMTAGTATVYAQLDNMQTIKKMVDRDIGSLKAISKSRLAIPKKLAETTVKAHTKKGD